MLRGSAQNPDVFFQAREAANPFYRDAPEVVQQTMDHLARTHGTAVPAVRLRGASPGRARSRADGVWGRRRRGGRRGDSTARGERVGLVKVRLFRPFSAARARRGAARRRTGDRGARPDQGAGSARRTALPGRRHLARRGGGGGRPRWPRGRPRVIGGRYGLSSKEFTPRDGEGRARRARSTRPPRSTSPSGSSTTSRTRACPWTTTSTPRIRRDRPCRVLRTGQRRHRQRQQELDQDHRRGAPTCTPRATSCTTRRRPARSPCRTCGSGPSRSDRRYLIRPADFVACPPVRATRTHRRPVRSRRPGATFLLNSPFGRRRRLGPPARRDRTQRIVDKQLRFFVVDGYRVAKEAGLGNADQHRAADVLLRAGGHPADRRGDRRRSRTRS